MRMGGQKLDAQPGDWCAAFHSTMPADGVLAGRWCCVCRFTFPTGPDYAHCFLNTGTELLRYLCLSTKSPVDICGYPDSKCGRGRPCRLPAAGRCAHRCTCCWPLSPSLHLPCSGLPAVHL